MNAYRLAKGRNGFTLVELVVVMVTLGVLLTAALSFLLFSVTITGKIEKASKKNDTLRSALTRIKQEASVSTVTWLCDKSQLAAVLSDTDTWGEGTLVVFETDGGDTLESKRKNGITGVYEDTPGKTVVIYEIRAGESAPDYAKPPYYALRNYIADLKKVRFSLSDADTDDAYADDVVAVRFYDTDTDTGGAKASAPGAKAFLADEIYMPNIKKAAFPLPSVIQLSGDSDSDYEVLIIKPKR